MSNLELLKEPGQQDDHDCTKEKIYWGQLLNTYKDDGTAIAWQIGFCSKCSKRMMRPFIEGVPKAA